MVNCKFEIPNMQAKTSCFNRGYLYFCTVLNVFKEYISTFVFLHVNTTLYSFSIEVKVG